jgi:NADPH-dependent 2,4-dienoyl-CoA reductase/sulfur reductase-like enzyme
VKVFEASDAPGGQLRLASRAGWRKDVDSIIAWRMSELDHLGVEVNLNQYVELDDVIAEQPNTVICATGGIPDLEWLPGHDLGTSVWDILSGITALKDDVVVYDGTGRHPALTVAEFCKDAGKQLSLVLLDDRPGAEIEYGERVTWKRELARKGIAPLLERRLTGIEKDGDRLLARFTHELTDVQFTLSADQVIVEHGTVPCEELFQALRPHSRNDGVTEIKHLLAGKKQPDDDDSGRFALYRIGDAVASRNLAAAMFDALRLCSVM